MNSTPERLEGTVDPKLLEILVCPLTKGPLEFDAAQAGTDLALGKARLSDPRRHPDHAAGRGPKDRLGHARPNIFCGGRDAGLLSHGDKGVSADESQIRIGAIDAVLTIPPDVESRRSRC